MLEPWRPSEISLTCLHTSSASPSTPPCGRWHCRDAAPSSASPEARTSGPSSRPLRDDADEHLLGARSRSSTRSSTSTAPARSSQRSSASPWRTDSTRIARWRPESCPAARWSCPTRPDDPTRGTAWVLSAEYEACSVAGRACTFVVGRRALGTSVDWLIVAPRLRDRVEASRNSIAMPGLFADQLRGGCQHCDTSARRGDRKAVRLGRSKVHCTVTVRTRRPALQSY